MGRAASETTNFVKSLAEETGICILPFYYLQQFTFLYDRKGLKS